MKGPYTLRNIPLFLMDWKPNFNQKRDMLHTLSIWIKLSGEEFEQNWERSWSTLRN